MAEVNVSDIRKALNYLRGTVHQEAVWNLLDDWVQLGAMVHTWLDNVEGELTREDELTSTTASEQSTPCGNVFLGALHGYQGFTCSEPATELVAVRRFSSSSTIPLNLCTYHADKFRLQQLMASETASGESL